MEHSNERQAACWEKGCQTKDSVRKPEVGQPQARLIQLLTNECLEWPASFILSGLCAHWGAFSLGSTLQ